MSPLSPSVSSALAFCGVSAVACAQGVALVASGSGRVARLALARRVLLSAGWVSVASVAWRVGAGAAGSSIWSPVLFAFAPGCAAHHVSPSALIASLAH